MNNMKYGVNIQATLLAIVICFFCINYEANGQEQTGTLRDRDGNIYTIKIMPDNKTWMTSNLNINIPGSFCYENAGRNCEQYGRLYTWKLAQEGCDMLGEGWHLPTNEEWQQMAKHYGGVRGDSDNGGKAAFHALIKGGNSGFDVLFGGARFPDGYSSREAHGFFWSATETDTATAWFYNFGKNGKIMNGHEDGERGTAISVRCIRDTLKEQ